MDNLCFVSDGDFACLILFCIMMVALMFYAVGII
jgi:hypothetical protein